MSARLEFPRWPSLSEEDIDAVVAVLRSNRLSQQSSDAVGAFEAAMAAYHGVDHAIAVSTGTAAVQLALAALGVGPGDEVIVPAHTFVGTASPVVHQGARPVFADVDPVTHCIDPASVAALIGERTRAVIAVHINGCPADMEALLAVAGSAGVPVVEDACQALGARIGTEPVGTLGAIACISLWEEKVITAGEGGVVLTRDPSHAQRVRRLRDHGHTLAPDGSGLIWSCEAGYNHRLTAMQAALAGSQLRRLDALVRTRRANAAHLSAGLAGTPGLRLPSEPAGALHSFWKYVVGWPAGDGRPPARALVAALRERGVPAALRYPFPLHRQPLFAPCGEAHCPVADRLSAELVTLPVHPALDRRHLDLVVGEVRRAVGDPGA